MKIIESFKVFVNKLYTEIIEVDKKIWIIIGIKTIIVTSLLFIYIINK